MIKSWKLSALVVFTFLILALPVYALNSSNFLTQAQRWVERNCSRFRNPDQYALFCYLFAKSGEVDPRLEVLEGSDATMSAAIAHLQQRVATLENLSSPSGLQDDFSGPNLNTNLWEVFENGGSYQFDNGFLVIPGGSAVPFFRTKTNPFPISGPFSVEFGIQFTTVNGGGDGLGISFTQQANVADANMWPNNPLAIWQDPVGFRIVSYGSNAFTIAASDSNYHVVKITYDGQKYIVSLDNNLIYTSPNTATVGGLWFGHPFYCCPDGGQWTGFKLDYIKVTQP